MIAVGWNFEFSYPLPNRYPGTPLHMLWIPKTHDKMETRAAALVDTDPNGEKQTRIFQKLGKRERILFLLMS